MTIQLSEIPDTPAELEEYVAALFQASRYYVDKNIIERDHSNVLELDVVATSYENPEPFVILTEAKSGSWGFSDLFKVLGWMTYLDIPRGCLFVSKERSDRPTDQVNKKLAHLDLHLVPVSTPQSAIEQMRSLGYGEPIDDVGFVIWRYYYWVERLLVDCLRSTKRRGPARAAAQCALEYHYLINNTIFFERNPQVRLHSLYQAFQDHPRLSLGAAREIQGHSFDPAYVDPTNSVMRDALLHGKHDVVQACFYVEHRARIAIIKSAIDCVPAIIANTSNEIDILYTLLPGSAREAIQQLVEHESARRYPLLWQVFLWGFGGFLLTDKTTIEYRWLADQTGIPETEIGPALQLYDQFFPSDDSWFTISGPTCCEILKMVPAQTRGVGAFQRLWRYNVSKYQELGYNDYTANDLCRWNNLTVEFLKSSLEKAT